MIIKSKIIRDTVFLTIMQLILDSSALLLNIFITQRLGAPAIGILSLTGSFLVLAGMLSNGNAFLCMSRLVSEEIGKKSGNPDKILGYAVAFCAILSGVVGIFLVGTADWLSVKFFKSDMMAAPVKLMAYALPIGAFCAVLRGYFNAFRRVGVTAVSDLIDFAVKSAVIVISTLTAKSFDDGAVCMIMVRGIICGNIASVIFLTVNFVTKKEKYRSKASVSFGKYISFAFPIMFGSCLTSALSSTNDALIPITLKQYGDSVTEALSRFGIFEAIVIPTLFFPSIIMCSLSGIVVSEAARAAAAKDSESIKRMAKKLIEKTLIFSIFAAAVLMKFGGQIGVMMDGGELAGHMITVIAPVVPFIYLEIVLEALIKGMGMQGFSSLNYFAEYAVRISTVLILVPKIGFYGIVASYYASNVIGNTGRLVKVIRCTHPKISIMKSLILPILYCFLTMSFTELLLRIMRLDNESVISAILFTVIWSAGYLFMLSGFTRRRSDLKQMLKHIPNVQNS